MLKVDNIGLPNLLLGKSYYTELIQNKFTKESIYEATKKISSLKEDSKNIEDFLRDSLKGVGFNNAAKEISIIK